MQRLNTIIPQSKYNAEFANKSKCFSAVMPIAETPCSKIILSISFACTKGKNKRVAKFAGTNKIAKNANCKIDKIALAFLNTIVMPAINRLTPSTEIKPTIST